MLCDNLEGWDRDGGREAQEGGEKKNCPKLFFFFKNGGGKGNHILQ